jgi:hypothetical protein
LIFNLATIRRGHEIFRTGSQRSLRLHASRTYPISSLCLFEARESIPYGKASAASAAKLTTVTVELASRRQKVSGYGLVSSITGTARIIG